MGTLSDFFSLLQERRWIAISLTGGALALAVFWWSVIPRARSAYGSYRAWQQKEKRIRSAQNWRAQLSRLQQEQRRLERRLDSLFVSLPPGDRMSVVLEVLQKRADQTGITLRQVRPRAKARFETYEMLPIDIALRGRYHSIARFIDRIERSQYLMRVEEVTMQTKEMVSSTVQTKIRMNLVTLRERHSNKSGREPGRERQDPDS